MDAFDTIIVQILINEGGYVNDPDDPGGETKFGISKKDYPNLDIKNLTIDQAKTIYKSDYYMKMGLDHLNDTGVQYYAMDMGVNIGTGRGVKILQHALRIPQDGEIGPDTVNAVNAATPHTLVDEMIELRVKYYVSLVYANPVKVKFLSDWIVRSFVRI